jgi:hypothetical protein
VQQEQQQQQQQQQWLLLLSLNSLVYRYKDTAHNEGEEERGNGRERQDAEAG